MKSKLNELLLIIKVQLLIPKQLEKRSLFW